MGRKFLSFTLFVFLFAASACEKKISETKPQNVKSAQTSLPVPTPSVPKDGNYDGKGTVTKINNEGGSIEINHEKIKDLMPAMQMEFFVKDKTLLKGLAVGDKVDFVLEYKHPGEIIVSLKKTQ
jgi:Cu(I)/Ag(I) efflux system protein CusF